MYIINSNSGIPHVVLNKSKTISKAIKKYFQRQGTTIISVSKTEQDTPVAVLL